MDLPEKNEKESYGKLDIDINDKKVTPGHSIKGEVKFKVEDAIEGCTFTIEIIGREYCFIRKGTPQENDVEQIIDHIKPDIKTIIEHQSCAPGTDYKHEYKFKIPDNAPASFEAETGHAKGYIRYMVMAKVTARGKKDLIAYKQVKVKEKIAEEGTLSETREGTVTGYCYANKGRLKMTCKVESLATLSKVDHNIEGSVTVDNRGCPYTIKQLNAAIAENVNFHAQGRYASATTTIVSWHLAEVKPSDLKEEKFKIEVPFSKRFKTLATSQQGSLMKRSYNLTIVPEYDTFTCCVPTINIPFKVQNLKLHKSKDHK